MSGWPKTVAAPPWILLSTTPDTRGRPAVVSIPSVVFVDSVLYGATGAAVGFGMLNKQPHQQGYPCKAATPGFCGSLPMSPIDCFKELHQVVH